MVLHSVLPSHTTLCIGFFHDPCSLSLDLQNINTKYMRVFVFSVVSEYYQNFLCSGFVFLKMPNLKINLLSLSYCENRNWSERNLYAVTSLRFLKNQIIQGGLPKLRFPQGISSRFLGVISFVLRFFSFRTVDTVLGSLQNEKLR